MKIEPAGDPYYRVNLARPRLPVGGFKEFDEAFRFALNNIRVAPGVDKEAVVRKMIDKYQPTRKAPVHQFEEV